jgi:iron complex outermembrane recepter protein
MGGMIGLAAQSLPPSQDDSRWADVTVEVERLLVEATRDDDDYDDTGFGGQDAEREDPPFSNSLIGGWWREEADHVQDLQAEMTRVATADPIELATGVGRANLRGFPTPRLRNGFVQQGIPEVLDVQRTETIQGPLTQVTGRAAPGGIQNLMTARPRPRPFRQLRLDVNTDGTRAARYETHAPLVPRKSWYRLAVNGSQRDGPQAHAYRDQFGLHGSLAVRHSAKASTLFQFDLTQLDANVAPAIPEFRATRTGKIAGPYLPLADFNSAGPNAGLLKRVAHASVQFEAQRTATFGYRASVQGFTRDLVERRWTLGQFLLDQGVFGGNREPFQLEQPLHALAAQFDAQWRVTWAGTDHRILASLAHQQVEYERLQRGLTATERAALPLDVRVFDPFAPNYFRPAYRPDTFQRFIADRTEVTGYSTLFLSDRAAWSQGRLVTTLGVRADRVELELEDRRPNAPFAETRTTTAQGTWHGGVNYLAIPNRVLLFTNVSTAFYPSTRVDARTAQLQGNATTRGLEFGARGVAWDERVNFSTLIYALKNQNISRRNPLYNDPIQDANLTQPELVAAGEEEFVGGVLDVHTRLTPQWTMSGRAGYTRAVTTKSPDLPEEVGRRLTRLPAQTLSVNTRYAFAEGPWQGLSLGASLVHLGDYVQTYERTDRELLTYPDYTVLSLNAGYRWRKGKQNHSLSLNLRNALDRDLLSSHARVDAARELGMNYNLVF